MRAREFVVKEQRTDELAPVLGTLAQGAKAVGGAAVNAVKTGATNLAVAGAKKLAGTQIGQKVIGAVANAAGEPGQANSNSSGQAVGTSAAPAGPTTGGQQAAGGAQAQPDQKAQAQQQQQMQQQQQAGQQTMTNLDKIAAQIVALKQDLAKQQQAMK